MVISSAARFLDISYFLLVALSDKAKCLTEFFKKIPSRIDFDLQSVHRNFDGGLDAFHLDYFYSSRACLSQHRFDLV